MGRGAVRNKVERRGGTKRNETGRNRTKLHVERDTLIHALGDDAPNHPAT